MDAANVWYYGVKDGQMWVYDLPFDDLDCLGDVAKVIDELLDEWEAAAPD